MSRPLKRAWILIILILGAGVFLLPVDAAAKTVTKAVGAKLTIPVSSTMCAEDNGFLIKSIQETPGILGATINPKSHVLVVRYDSQRVTSKNIKNIVNVLGFSPNPKKAGNELQVIDYKIEFH